MSRTHPWNRGRPAPFVPFRRRCARAVDAGAVGRPARGAMRAGGRGRRPRACDEVAASAISIRPGSNWPVQFCPRRFRLMSREKGDAQVWNWSGLRGRAARRRPVGAGTGPGEDRLDQCSVGPVRRCRHPARQRRQDLHEAARRQRRRQEDRDHPPGRRRPRPGCRQAAGAGADRARRRRHAGRIPADAERARRRRRIRAGEEIHGGDECRDLDHHHQVAVHDPHLGDVAAGHGDIRHLGRQERAQEVLHHGDGLWPRSRLRGGIPARLQGRRRRDRRSSPLSGRQSRFLRLRPARQGHRSGMHLHLHSGRRPAGGARQGVRRARHRSEQDQGAGLGRDHRRAGTQGHGRCRARHHLGVALRLQGHGPAQRRVREDLQRDARAQPGLLLDRRLRRHARHL